MAKPLTLRGYSRVFIIENRAGPNRSPTYMGLGFAGGVDKSYGDVEEIEVPSPLQRGAYTTVDEFNTGDDRASLPLTLRYPMQLSYLQQLQRKRCPVDIQVHFGSCEDPRDFYAGWHTGHIDVFENAFVTNYTTTELGAYQSDDEGAVDEEAEFSIRDFYQIGPISSFAARASSEIVQEIVAVVVCDSVQCGDCDDPSDGCQKVFAVAAPAGSSPGLLPEVVISDDGFTTVSQQSDITSLAAGEDPNDAACVGENLVVISEDSDSLHYAVLSELLLGTETWSEVTSGFVIGNGPQAIDNLGPFDTWIVGENGYVYYTEDPADGVTVQDAGNATTEHLNDVDVFDLNNVVAVGANNAVIYTLDGGSTWASVTGPAVGVDLLSVAHRNSEKEWWVGDAGGNLWYTLNRGTTWTQKAFPGDGSGNVRDIVWASDTVGFIAHDTASVGHLLRTTSGGFKWTRLPDGTTALTAVDRLNSLAVCEQNVNTLYAGGLADNAADGVLLKGSSPVRTEAPA